MLYPSITDTLTFTPSNSVAFGAASTISARLKQEPRRLEAILVAVTATTGAATAANCDGAAGLLKEVRLRVTDILGTRNAVQVAGPALLSWNRQNFGTLDRYSWQAYAAGAAGTIPAATAVTTVYLIPIRHPIIGEPFGNALSLPLSQKYLKDDPILELDFYAAATVFSAGAVAANYTVEAMGIYREVPESYPYIPTELRTDRFNPGSATKQTFDLAGGGYLTSVLIQGYSSGTYGNAVTRVGLVSAGGLLTLDYGRISKRKGSELLLRALNDYTQEQVRLSGTTAPAGDQMERRTFDEVFLDFLSDFPGLDAFSANSILNLNTQALGGDKCRLVFNDFANAAYEARITTHKLLPTDAAQLAALSMAI